MKKRTSIILDAAVRDAAAQKAHRRWGGNLSRYVEELIRADLGEDVGEDPPGNRKPAPPTPSPGSIKYPRGKRRRAA